MSLLIELARALAQSTTGPLELRFLEFVRSAGGPPAAALTVTPERSGGTAGELGAASGGLVREPALGAAAEGEPPAVPVAPPSWGAIADKLEKNRDWSAFGPIPAGYSSPLPPWVVKALAAQPEPVERHAITTALWKAAGMADPSGDPRHGAMGRTNLGDAITRCLQELLKVKVVTLEKRQTGKVERSYWGLAIHPADPLPHGPHQDD